MSVVLILGARSDMGLAIAKKFAANGYDIQLAGRDTYSLAASRSDIEIRYQVKSSVHAFDAMDFASHQQFYAGLPQQPDITICVFGFMDDNEKAWHNWQTAERSIATNYTGAVSILNIIAADYATKKKGVIAGISSVAGIRGRQSNFIYGSAKAGFTAYLSGLRNRLYPEGVHVVTILPGFIYTRMTQDLDLPKLLTGSAADVGNAVYKAVLKKKNIIYIKWFWRWIMLIIKMIPESMFKKKKL